MNLVDTTDGEGGRRGDVDYKADHQGQQRQEGALQEEEELMLGGTESKLQRDTPYKQRWKLMKDGDLWETFADIVKQRGPHSVWITKVKGARYTRNCGRTESGRGRKERE